jgi:DNA (cytosine-5)-methyltransferase 1
MVVDYQQSNNNQSPQFIDVFAGAGGLSLGLMQAGWSGLLAVEKSPMAFETLKFNLIDVAKHRYKFNWPDWFPKGSIDIKLFIDRFGDELNSLKGIPLLAGGPPCQGFSRAGRRDPGDERNHLFEDYLGLVNILSPNMVVLENVSGFAETFGGADSTSEEDMFNADEVLQKNLRNLGYIPFVNYAIKAMDFGVPQTRPRYILIGLKEEIHNILGNIDPIQELLISRTSFLESYSLPINRNVTLKEAISDLLFAHGTVQCIEPRMKNFKQGSYGEIQGRYQELMRQDPDGKSILKGIADSHRFANHKPNTIVRLQRILDEFRPGKQLSKEELHSINMSKHRIARLSGDEPCHTLTGSPDDLVHYCEPRIPTVREYARIQSFPDWFQFKSTYTTGGKRRRVDVPRYTQVANAVPPFVGEAIGRVLIKLHLTISRKKQEYQNMFEAPSIE